MQMQPQLRCGKRSAGSELEDVEVLIRNIIAKLSSLNGAGDEIMVENFMLEITEKIRRSKHEVQKVLDQCVTEWLVPNSAFTTFLALVNLHQFDFVENYIIHMINLFSQALENEEWENTRRIFCFIVDLVNPGVITTKVALRLLNELMEVSNDNNASGNKKDWHVYVILSAIPHIGQVVSEKKENELLVLLDSIGNYLKNRSRVHVQLLQVWSTNIQMDYLELLYKQVSTMCANSWQDSILQRPYRVFEDQLGRILTHGVPTLLLKMGAETDAEVNHHYPNPWVVFQLNCDPPEVRLPLPFSIDRHFIEQQILEILNRMHLNCIGCAKKLLEFCDSLPSITSLRYCVLEVLVGQLLNLPKPHLLPINCSLIIVHLCRMQPMEFNPLVELVVQALHKSMDTMDVGCFDRCVDWFSHHLSQLGYKFNWLMLANEIDGLDKTTPRVAFVQELLQKCLRLSYYQGIKSVTPEPLFEMLPPPPEHDFKYIDERLEGSRLVKQLLEAIRSHCSPEIVGGLLEASDVMEARKINILMQILLHLGCKTFTHSTSQFQKFEPVLKVIITGPSSECEVIRAVLEVWKNSEQRKIVMIDKLLKMSIIRPSTLIDYVFSDQMQEEIHKMYVWEILNRTIRITKHVKATTTTPFEDDTFNALCNRVIRNFTKVKWIEQQEHWYDWTLGRLKEFLFTHIDDAKVFIDELNAQVFRAQLDSGIEELIQIYLHYINYYYYYVYLVSEYFFNNIHWWQSIKLCEELQA